jgi:hypothetical protein
MEDVITIKGTSGPAEILPIKPWMTAHLECAACNGAFVAVAHAAQAPAPLACPHCGASREFDAAATLAEVGD